MKQSGLSVSAISEMTGYDRKTVRKYLLEPEAVPTYGWRAAKPSKLDPHKGFLQERLTAGVWNAQVQAAVAGPATPEKVDPLGDEVEAGGIQEIRADAVEPSRRHPPRGPRPESPTGRSKE